MSLQLICSKFYIFGSNLCLVDELRKKYEQKWNKVREFGVFDFSSPIDLVWGWGLICKVFDLIYG